MKIYYPLILFSVFWFACSAPADSPENKFNAPAPDAKHVEILELSPVEFNDVIELTGTVEAKKDVIVSAKTTGTLERIVPLGRAVGIGQVIANTEDDLLQASVSQADAQVQNAEASLRVAEESYNRQKPLFADSIISPLEFTRLESTLDQAKSALAQATAIYDQAQRQLQYTSIIAPIAGKVEAHYVEAGEQVVPGTEVLRLVDTRNVQISAGVSERYAGDIVFGTPAEVSLPTANILSRSGRVIFAGNVIDPDSRSFEVNIEVDNADGRLKPEMIAQLAILRTTIDGALVIPGNTVTRTENGLSVFVVEQHDGNHVAKMRTVTLGADYANQVVVVSGLSAGEQVVVRGQSTLANNDLVTIDQTYSELDESGVPVIGTSPESSPL